jgi:hypothetical protein
MFRKSQEIHGERFVKSGTLKLAAGANASGVSEP